MWALCDQSPYSYVLYIDVRRDRMQKVLKSGVPKVLPQP